MTLDAFSWVSDDLSRGETNPACRQRFERNILEIAGRRHEM
jgi:hypothetical protein